MLDGFTFTPINDCQEKCLKEFMLCFWFVFLRLVCHVLPVSLDFPFWYSVTFNHCLVLTYLPQYVCVGYFIIPEQIVPCRIYPFSLLNSMQNNEPCFSQSSHKLQFQFEHMTRGGGWPLIIQIRPIQNLDFKRHMSWSLKCSMILSQSWLLALLIMMRFLIIIVLTFFS